MTNYLGRRRILPICGVYKIENLIDGKVYIGKSKNIGIRWSQHKKELNNGIHINTHLQNAWNKYGSNCFRFEIIYVTKNEDDALKMEEYYIEKYESNKSKTGYNLTTGGQSGFLSEESKIKVSNAKMGKYNNLSFNDIKRIKMLTYCFMDLQEIANIYNVPISTIRNIVQAITYKHIFKEINPLIKNVKQQIIDDRNYQIIKLYNKGYKIFQIRDIMNLSNSIVEKCIYKYCDIGSQKDEQDNSKLNKEVINLYFNKGMSSNKINDIVPISKAKILEIINKYKRDILGTLNQCKPLDKGALFI